MKKKQMLLYEAPIARDLSGLAVQGQVQPQGMCTGGGGLTYVTCTPNGVAPYGVLCSPTGATVTASCAPTGVSPEYGYCQPTGGAAFEGCGSGGIHS